MHPELDGPDKDEPEVVDYQPGSPWSRWALSRYLVGRAMTGIVDVDDAASIGGQTLEAGIEVVISADMPGVRRQVAGVNDPDGSRLVGNRWDPVRSHSVIAL